MSLVSWHSGGTGYTDAIADASSHANCHQGVYRADGKAGRQADRQTDRQTETDRQAGRQEGRQEGRQAGRQKIYNEIALYNGRETERQRDRETERQRDRQTEGPTRNPSPPSCSLTRLRPRPLRARTHTMHIFPRIASWSCLSSSCKLQAFDTGDSPGKLCGNSWQQTSGLMGGGRS